MADVTYRTLAGFVYSGPYENDAGGKKIQKVYISVPMGIHEDDLRVAVTIWPSHKNADVKVGDYIVVNGKFEGYESQDQSGKPETKWSISANKLTVLGHDMAEEEVRATDKVQKEAVIKKRNEDFTIPGL